jgi:2-C-methyl-D-erythritol 4-phosphate cytidylyltransferase
MMENAVKYVVVVAGGSGLRMGADIPKQFLPLAGRPVLMHTLLRFTEAYPDIALILVLPEAHHDYWRRLCREHSFDKAHTLVVGGNSRFQSVKNGLNRIPEKEGLVAIHDGVRPFVHPESIRRSFEVAATLGNATLAVPMKDSLRRVTEGQNTMVLRHEYRIIQTPQTFRLALIKKAFETPELPSFTDDASVLEHAGGEINLVEGTYENIKITTPEDMVVGEALLRFVQDSKK